ncbi:hypothetical protein HC62_03650 [Acetobacter tropicalis]|uniref:Uncharacterized protein n=1 Tax=Acetobacter tropicalis TaxID=104102 RepID=A0A252AAR0_9PROT|nr:hypothetical protein HC62_03650 [Acetobacter tropicalis]
MKTIKFLFDDKFNKLQELFETATVRILSGCKPHSKYMLRVVTKIKPTHKAHNRVETVLPVT